MNTKILTITGRPGIGKSTLIKRLLAFDPRIRIFAGKSVTTRSPRLDDVPNEYEHVSQETFDELNERGAFLWTAHHNNSWYGTRTDDVAAALRLDSVSVMTLTPEVLSQLYKFTHAQRDRVLSCYITTPNEERDVMDRMVRLRGDDIETVKQRAAETEHWRALVDSLNDTYGCVHIIENHEEEKAGDTAARAIYNLLR